MGKKSKRTKTKKTKQPSKNDGGSAADNPSNEHPPSLSTNDVSGNHESRRDNSASTEDDPLAKMNELISSLSSLSNRMGIDPMEMEELQRYPPRDTNIGYGRVVVLDGLKSETGKKLNGQYALVLASTPDDDGRWECRVLHRSRTIGIKIDNMNISKPEKSVHPNYMKMASYVMGLSAKQWTTHQEYLDETRGKFRAARGICYDDEPLMHRVQKLVQLLDYPDPDNDYEPNQTVLLGDSKLFYSSVVMHESSFVGSCTMYDLEHMAACLSLACMCQGENMMPQAVGCGDGLESSECVVFALLEAAPRSLQALLQFIVMTPNCSGKGYEGDDPNLFHRSMENPALTHAQDTKAYCEVMKGPLGMMCFLLINAPNDCSRALFQTMQDRFGTLFELMLRRLFSLLLREHYGTADGIALGKYTRNILANMANLDGAGLSPILHYYLCECDGSFRVNLLGQCWLLEDQGIKRYDQLTSFLGSVIDPDIANDFWEKEH